MKEERRLREPIYRKISYSTRRVVVAVHNKIVMPLISFQKA